MTAHHFGAQLSGTPIYQRSAHDKVTRATAKFAQLEQEPTRRFHATRLCWAQFSRRACCGRESELGICMSHAHPFCTRALLLVGGFAAACTASVVPHAGDDGAAPSPSSAADAGASGAPNPDTAHPANAGNAGKNGTTAHAGAGGKPTNPGAAGAADSGVQVSGVPGDAALTSDAGAGGDPAADRDAGDASSESECDLDGGCAAVCHGQAAHCTVELAGFSCELDAFQSASANVACGETSTVGTALCGGCGSVDVQLYFDGTRCWEGLPGCTRPEYSGKFFLPHPPD